MSGRRRGRVSMYCLDDSRQLQCSWDRWLKDYPLNGFMNAGMLLGTNGFADAQFVGALAIVVGVGQDQVPNLQNDFLGFFQGGHNHPTEGAPGDAVHHDNAFLDLPNVGEEVLHAYRREGGRESQNVKSAPLLMFATICWRDGGNCLTV